MILTAKQRLERCYNHLEVDRPAVFCRASDMPKNDPSYRPLRELIETKGDLKFSWNAEALIEKVPYTVQTEEYSDDFAREIRTIHPPAGTLTASRLIGLHGQPGYVEKHFLETPEDVDRYVSFPAPAVGGGVDGFFETLRAVGNRGIVSVRLGFNPASWVVELFGSERFAVMSVTHRDLLHRMMVRRRDSLVALVKSLIDRGVGPFFATAGQEYIVPPLHGRNDFVDFNLRHDKPIFDLIHESGGRIHVHCHGRVKTVIEDFVSAGVDVLHPFEAPPMGDIEPSEAKALVSDVLCLEGNIQIADMYEKSPDDIRRQVENLVTEVFYDRRNLIVCPTASPYIVGAGGRCLEQYRAMIEAVAGL